MQVHQINTVCLQLTELHANYVSVMLGKEPKIIKNKGNKQTKKIKFIKYCTFFLVYIQVHTQYTYTQIHTGLKSPVVQCRRLHGRCQGLRLKLTHVASNPGSSICQLCDHGQMISRCAPHSVSIYVSISLHIHILYICLFTYICH